MAILAIETATDACSVAIEHGDIVEVDHRVVPRLHSRLLLEMVDGVVEQAGARREDLSLVAFGCGPGSFTGVRIAAAAVQGIALALDLPVARVSTLEILACTAWRRNPHATGIVTALHSRANEVLLAAWVARGGRLVEALEAMPFDLGGDAPLAVPDEAFVAAGDRRAELMAYGARQGRSFVDGGVAHPEARDLLRLARRAQEADALVAADQAIPVYLAGGRTWRKVAR